MRVVRTTKNNEYTIPDDTEISTWFDEYEQNCSQQILDSLNSTGMFQSFFDNTDDLVVLDLGANIGLFSMYVQDSAKRVISVEPTPKTFNVLNKMVSGHQKIELLQGAVNDQDGEITFSINENPTINSMVNNVGEKITVDAYTFDSIMKKFNLDHIDFVKCDIEGGEVVAFNDQTLGAVADKITTWAVELHQTNANTGASWPGNLEENRQNLAALFQRHGYKTECVIHDQLFAWKDND
jgi:FkbM family methyltransferase